MKMLCILIMGLLLLRRKFQDGDSTLPCIVCVMGKSFSHPQEFGLLELGSLAIFFKFLQKIVKVLIFSLITRNHPTSPSQYHRSIIQHNFTFEYKWEFLLIKWGKCYYSALGMGPYFSHLH
jgi:hypothetical protein